MASRLWDSLSTCQTALDAPARCILEDDKYLTSVVLMVSQLTALWWIHESLWGRRKSSRRNEALTTLLQKTSWRQLQWKQHRIGFGSDDKAIVE
jgi:hypothetical protein